MTADTIKAIKKALEGLFINERISDNVMPEPNSGCWIWVGGLNQDGYARYHNKRVHRLSYETYVGPIPEGLVIDHRCRVRCCVNPNHLRCMTSIENVLIGESVTGINLAKIFCDKGHEFTRENTRARFRNGRERRECKECQRNHLRAHRKRKFASIGKAAALSSTGDTHGN